MSLDLVAGVLEQAGEGVADNRVAGATDVDRTGRVRAGVLDDDAPAPVPELAVSGVLCGGERRAEVPVGGKEVHVGPTRVDAADVAAVVGVDGRSEFGCDLGRRLVGDTGKPEGGARREDGVDICRWLLDTEVVDGVVERIEGRRERFLDLRAHREEHTSRYSGGRYRDNGFRSARLSRRERLTRRLTTFARPR